MNFALATILAPASLPEDASYIGTTNMRGAIVQRFERTNGSFTVSQGPANAVSERGDTGTAVVVRGVEGTLFTNEEGDQALLTWSDGDVTFWVGGNVTGDEALAIAESLE